MPPQQVHDVSTRRTPGSPGGRLPPELPAETESSSARRHSHENGLERPTWWVTRAAPVLLVAIYGNRAAICGPSGDNPPVLTNVELSQAERLCITALGEPDRHSALRFLRPALEAIDSPMAGVRNEGLLSTHEIGVWLKERRDITEAKAKSATALTKTGQQLVMSLGFEVSPLPGPASVLISQSQKLALAVFLDRGESPDTASQRF